LAVLIDPTGLLYHSLVNGAKLPRQQLQTGRRSKGSDAEMEVVVDRSLVSQRPAANVRCGKKRSRDPARDPCLSFTRRRKEYIYYTP
jgi:hypothetical protein